MSNLVIVAIPQEDELVWDISSEKVPHLTICFLGPAEKVANTSQIESFLEHAASTVLERFWLDVDKRGKLGDDEADVIFFRDGWELPKLKEFRAFLLMDENIRKAFDSIEQYPEWTPHLTLGYPDKPAAELEQGQKIYDVRFDRIALWYGDFEGPEFELKTTPYGAEVSMSTQDVIDNILTHYGVKGMRWGVRKDRPSGPTSVKVTTGTTKKGKTGIQTEGGHNQPAHKDAIGAKKTHQILKESGPNALSNKELQELANRIDLELRVTRLTTPPEHPAKKFIKQLLGQQAQQQASRVANQYATRQVDAAMAKKMKK